MRCKKSYFTVTEKGQVTIPRIVRQQLGIEPGTQLVFDVEGDKMVVTKATVVDRVSAVYGILGRHNTDTLMARLRPLKK